MDCRANVSPENAQKRATWLRNLLVIGLATIVALVLVGWIVAYDLHGRSAAAASAEAARNYNNLNAHLKQLLATQAAISDVRPQAIDHAGRLTMDL